MFVDLGYGEFREYMVSCLDLFHFSGKFVINIGCHFSFF